METATLERNEVAAKGGRRKQILALLFVMFVAVLLRTVALGSVPMGLDPDEALNGNEAYAAHQAGEWPLFYPSNNGREGLFINLVGVSESVFGAGLVGLRIPAAAIGSLTVLFVFLLGEMLVGFRAAIFGSFLLATSFWHVLVSRTAFRAILMPLLLTASLYLLVRAFGEESANRRLWWAVVVLAFAAADFYRRRRRGESVLPWAAVMAVWWGVAVIAALPLALYFAHHPAEFSGRMNEL